MTDARSIPLPHRGILTISGEDRRSFLQGLVSNDVDKAGSGRAVWSAFLTPQGKFLHDFFLVEKDDVLLIDAEADRLEDFRKRLSMYKLRAKVAIVLAPEFAVHAVIGADAPARLGVAPEAGSAAPFDGGVAFLDPRLAAAGLRVIVPAETGAATLASAGLAPAAFADWDRLRLSLGLPDGSRDLTVEKAILLENGFDELGGVDWQKGCYMGQELTARTKYRGLVRKRLMPVEIEGLVPEPGTPVTRDGEEAGEMRSGMPGIGLAMIRLEQLEKGGTFTAGAATLRPRKPDWATF